jgi:hypothetical protein
VAGSGVFFLGYTLFFFTQNAQYSATGISNRVAIGPAIGIALRWVGGILVISSTIRARRVRDALFAAGVAAAAGTSVLIVGTIGSFWADAYRREQRVLRDIRLAFPGAAAGDDPDPRRRLPLQRTGGRVRCKLGPGRCPSDSLR